MDRQRSEGLEALLKAAGPAGAPRPVEAWNPPYCGDIGMAIRADGTWVYRGSPIARREMVKLFSSILRKDADGRTYLVTPVEKVDVIVEDVPFLAVEMAASGEGQSQSLTLRTNVDDVVHIDRDHPLRFQIETGSGGLKPYVTVRGRLEALFTRALTADLIALGLEQERDGAAGVWSGGVWWALES